MPIEDETEAWLRLGLVRGIGPAAWRALLRHYGSPAAALTADAASLRSLVPPAIAERVLAGPESKALARSLTWLEDPTHFLVTWADRRYPPLLLEIPDPPPILFVRGEPSWLARPTMAIVGSRNATPQGIANARMFAGHLAAEGLTIASGLALGIDAAAHEGALEGGGATVAVMGCGIDRVYPRGNAGLAARIEKCGAIVSEFPVGVPPLREHFPRRNRIISGLARGCLVVEAAASSGSLITARVAADQGREVFAIPGSIHSPVAKGCHALIKEGAKLVESAADVLDELGLSASAIVPKMSSSEDALLRHMGFDCCDLDALAGRTGLTTGTLSAMLLQLELEGRVGSLPGGRYQRIS